MVLLYLQWVVFAASMAFPIAFFAAPSGGVPFYLLVLCALIGVACRIRPMEKSLGELLREYWPVNLAMSGLFLAVLFNQLLSGRFSLRALEQPFQLACFPLLFWILLILRNASLRYLQWGMAAGTLFCVGVLSRYSAGGSLRPERLFDIPLIPFGNVVTLLGVLSLFSLGWNNRHQKLAIVLKMLVGGVALYGAYLSQARGGWVALPLFAIIGLVTFKNMRIHHKIVFSAVIVAILCGSYFFSKAIQGRIAEAQTDIQQYIDGTNKDTSVGQRLQLWQGALVLFRENPLHGIGRDRYPTEMERLVQRQIVTAMAAKHPHSHNDILFHMATLGIFGLFAILSLYIVPAYFFYKDIRHPNPEARVVAGMGLSVTLGFFVFGLSDVMFYWKVSYVFYAFLLAVLFACLAQRKAVWRKLVELQGVSHVSRPPLTRV